MSAEESEDEKDQKYCREGTSKPVQEIEGALREGQRSAVQMRRKAPTASA
jgi:hypothetical protein